MKNDYWLRSGFYTILEKVTALVFGFGGGVLLFRALSKEDFGIWVLFLSITSILEVGRIGLLQNALVKYLTTSVEKEETGRIITASFVLNLLLTACIVVLLYGGAGLMGRWLDSEQLISLLKIYCFTTFFLIPFFQGNYIQQANLDFRGIFFSNAAKGGVLFIYIFSLFLGKVEIELVNLAICQVVAAIVASIVSIIFAKKYTVVSRIIDGFWIRKLFRFGIFVFGTNFCAQLYKNVDKLLLGALPMGGKAAVAIYDAAIRVTNLTDVPTASMANILFPQSARRFEEGKDAVKQLYEKAVGAILAFMIPAVLFVLIFADWIIFVVAGTGYESSADVLRITILFGLFMPYVVQFGTVLDSIGKPNINFFYTLLSLVFTVVLNLIFISWKGVYGAAIGTLSAYILTFVLMQLYLNKNLNINVFRPLYYMLYMYRQLFRIASQYFRGGFRLSAIQDVLKEE